MGNGYINQWRQYEVECGEHRCCLNIHDVEGIHLGAATFALYAFLNVSQTAIRKF